MKKISTVVSTDRGGFAPAGSASLALVAEESLQESYHKGARSKRTIDIVLALVALVLISPIALLIAIGILITSPGPIIFKQKRVGQNGELFEFFKFRSMRYQNDESIHKNYCQNLINGNPAGGDGAFKLKHDPRVTRLGAFLRKSSLDELPQLLNVLKGDMSLVGPRPPIDYEVHLYQDWHKRRLGAKPGITGLWQVSGRSQVPFDEMVLLDIHYMEHWSLMLDLKILTRTVPVVLFGVGGY